MNLHRLRWGCLLALQPFFPVLIAQDPESWTAFYGSSRNGSYATAVLADESGNVYVTGASKALNNYDVVTIKYGPGGEEEWVRVYDGSGKDYDVPVALRVDASGAVYVAVNSVVDFNRGSSLVLKYDSAGNEVAVMPYEVEEGRSHSPSAMALDTEGNLYLTGYSTDQRGFDLQSSTVKLDPEGKRLWSAAYGIGYTNGLAVDDDGNVYVTGQWISVDGNPGQWEFGTARYEATGRQRWFVRNRVNSLRTDIARAIALTPDGGVCVTGESDSECVTVKYRASGEKLWSHVFNRPEGAASGLSLAIDGQGNALVGGVTGSGPSADYLLLKLSPSGRQLWAARYDGPEHGEDRSNAMAVDREGNTVITGRSSEICATVKYDSEGRQIWAVRYGTPGGRCYGHDVELDQKGDAFVAGQILRGDTDQYLVLRYAGPTAPRFHRGDSNADGRLDIADGLCVLKALFSQGKPLECLDAADANDDGQVDCSDAVFTLGYLFLGTAPPPTPGPPVSPCGPDRPEPIPSGDLGCETYHGCVSISGV